jgi:phage terminase small subunit
MSKKDKETIVHEKKRSLSKSPKAAKMRRKIVIQGLIEGKTIKDAAILAGYSPKTAGEQGAAILQHPQAKQEFSLIMERKGLTDEILAQKIKDLLDAQETKYFQKDGIVTDQRQVDALETQRKTVELATKLKGHLKDKSEVDINVGLMALVVAAVREKSGGGGFEDEFDV